MEEIKIHSEAIKLVNVDSIIVNPKNNNQHPDGQIKQLEKIIQYQGFRNPLTVSNRTGFLICGECRLTAAKNLGMKQVPVMFQDFKDESAEYAHLTADNAIQQQSVLDYAKVNLEIGNLGPDFDLDFLGLKSLDIIIDPSFEPGSEADQQKLDELKPIVTQCPNCGECFDARQNKPKD